MPEVVLSMGLLDSLLLYDSWQGDPMDLDDIARSTTPQESASGLVTLPASKDKKLFVSAPANTYLPAYTARALYRHLREGWKLAEPRVALFARPVFRTGTQPL